MLLSYIFGMAMAVLATAYMRGRDEYFVDNTMPIFLTGIVLWPIALVLVAVWLVFYFPIKYLYSLGKKHSSQD